MTVQHSELMAYADELRGALARLGVATREAEQIVAEVLSHCQDTGERPVDAFGPAGVYAASYADGPPGSAAGEGGRGDGIPGWAKAVLSLLGLVLLAFSFPVLLVPIAAASGGVTGAEAGVTALVVVIAAAVAVLLVRAYRRRWGASLFGSWAVGLGSVLTVLMGLLLLGGAMVGSVTSRSCTMTDGVEQCTSGSGGSSPLAPGAGEIALLALPAVVVVLVLVGVLVAVFRAAGGRRPAGERSRSCHR